MTSVSDTAKLFISVVVAGGLIAFAFLTDERGVAPVAQEESGAQKADVAQGISRHLAVADFKERIAGENVVVIDVRTPEEYGAGYIAGARNIDFRGEGFVSELEKLDKKKPYALYCRTGNRSGQALALMREMGFTDVADLDGGIVAWESAGRALCTAGKVCMK